MHRKISLLIVAGLLQGSLIQAGDLPEPPAEDPTFKVPPKDGKCRAVALRGGGTKGAYEVGVLKGMVELMKPLEYAYDVIVGVSCGGINAGILATFSRGFEKVAVDFLWEMWANLPVTDLWQNWTLGPFEAIWRSSFVDNQPMIDSFSKIYAGREIKRGLALQAVDLDSGEVVIYDETMPSDFLGTAVAASASLPAIFSPVYHDQKTMVDGLVLSNLDLSEAITKCQDKGYDDEDIIVDVILCFGRVIKWNFWTWDQAKYKNAWDLYDRKEYFKEFYENYEDITRVVRGYPRVHFRHLITPLNDLGGGFIPLWDGTDVTQRFLQQGYDDAKDSLEAYFRFNPDERGAHPNVTSSNPSDMAANPRFTFQDIREHIATGGKSQ